MEIDGNLMASSNKKPRMNQPTNPINVSLTDFKKIATKFPNMLVDKTELIYIFCVGRTHELITAPSRFGKSVNLTMLRCFFRIEVDPKTGRLKTQLDPKTDAITDTENYRLFTDLNLAIMSYPDLVEKYFGRHPVLYVSFKCGRSIKTVDDAIELCRTVAHRSFEQHKYLCVSEKLADEDRALCRKWCFGDTHEKMDPSYALERLANFLYTHFKRDVVFLVDEYDSLVTRALVQADANSIEEICKKPVDMIAPLLKTDDDNIHVLGSLVTGVSYIAGIGWSDGINNIIPRRFTEHHRYNQFYGFQLKEIEGLLEKLEKLPGFKVEEKALDIIKAKYNGYEYPGSAGNPGEKIFCPWSVLNYLREGAPRSFWAGSAYTAPLQHMFKNDYVRKFLTDLLEENDKRTLPTVNKLSADDFVELKKYMKGILIQGSHELFLNFILELGYLTVDSTKAPTQTECCVKVPNLEVKVMILTRLKDYYEEKCSQKFKDNAVMKSETILNCINSAADPNVSDEKCKKALGEFRQELQTLFQQYSDSCLPIVNESGLHCFMAEIINTGNFYYFTDHYVLGTDSSNKGRLDVLGFRVEDFAFLVELKNIPTSRKSADDALNQILDKEYFNAFEHPTLLAANLKCHILMGISVNKDKKMAISAIRNYKKGIDSHRINIPFDE